VPAAVVFHLLAAAAAIGQPVPRQRGLGETIPLERSGEPLRVPACVSDPVEAIEARLRSAGVPLRAPLPPEGSYVTGLHGVLTRGGDDAVVFVPTPRLDVFGPPAPTPADQPWLAAPCVLVEDDRISAAMTDVEQDGFSGPYQIAGIATSYRGRMYLVRPVLVRPSARPVAHQPPAGVDPRTEPADEAERLMRELEQELSGSRLLDPNSPPMPAPASSANAGDATPAKQSVTRVLGRAERIIEEGRSRGVRVVFDNDADSPSPVGELILLPSPGLERVEALLSRGERGMIEIVGVLLPRAGAPSEHATTLWPFSVREAYRVPAVMPGR
jgi:hypothetical protein